MHFFANQFQRAFQISTGGFEGIGVDCQRRPQHHQRRAIFRRANRLLDRQSPHRLHRHLHGGNHFAQLIERAGLPKAPRDNAAPFIVADVMNHKFTTQIFQQFCPCDHVGAAKIVPHHLHPMLTTGFDNDFYGLRVCAGHHHHMCGPGFGHHLGFKISPIHRLQIRDDRNTGKMLAQGFNTMQSLGQDERRPGFKPIHARPHRQGGGFKRLVKIRQIQ